MLAIGRGIMADPKLLRLDEPSLGLSPLFVKTIFGIIQDIHAQGIAILLVEQNVNQALPVADRAYGLETGRGVLSGGGAELLKNGEERKAFLGLRSPALEARGTRDSLFLRVHREPLESCPRGLRSTIGNRV